MTKKHYIAIARRFAQLRKEAQEIQSDERFINGVLTGLNSAIMELAEALQIENPAFSRDKFIEACGVSV